MTGSLWNVGGTLCASALLLIAGCASVDDVSGEGEGLGSGNPSNGSGGSASGSSGGSSTGGGTASGGATDGGGTSNGGTSSGGTSNGGTTSGGTTSGGTTSGGTSSGGTNGAFECTSTQFFGTNLPAACDPCVIENCCEEVEGCFLEAGCSALNDCEAAAGQGCMDQANANGWGQAEFDQCVRDACPSDYTADRQARLDAAYACIRADCVAECYP